MKLKKTIAIVGGGPSSLMLAANLDQNIFDVSIYECNAAVGRKFLVAGNGGFNLTHSEPSENLIKRYAPAIYLKNCLQTFTGNDLRDWLSKIGIETYIGTSKRVFPVKGTKPIAVLNAVIKVLKDKNVRIHTKHRWMGWNDDRELIFSCGGNTVSIKPDITVFALGGASWAKTGSDGAWTFLFKKRGIKIIPFQASNCAFSIQWPPDFAKKYEGTPLKNISVACEDSEKKGEVVVTKSGIEGGAIYALSPQIRKQLNSSGTSIVYIDLKPVYNDDQILEKLTDKGKHSISNLLKTGLKMSELQISLLRNLLTKEEFMDSRQLAQKIKKLPLIITGMAPVDEAISTVGGIALNETDKNFQMKKLPGNYVIGEMLDWDAPTGGYLLQACFSMGYYLARHLNS